MTVSEHHKYMVKSKTDLIDEIINLTKQFRDKKAEIAHLQKKACNLQVSVKRRFFEYVPTSRELFIYDILLDIKSKFVTREKKIRGDIIKKSFDELEILGRSLKEAIIEHIERHDIKLDDVHYYTLKDIENLLAMTFGNDAARLIVLRLKRGIKTTT